jgi:hypothetical protein
MRYSIRYNCGDKSWIVADGPTKKHILGVHHSKASAYKQAITEHQSLRELDPIQNYLAKIRKIIPQTLVLPFSRNI